jgi:hypothetical protein
MGRVEFVNSPLILFGNNDESSSSHSLAGIACQAFTVKLKVGVPAILFHADSGALASKSYFYRKHFGFLKSNGRPDDDKTPVTITHKETDPAMFVHLLLHFLKSNKLPIVKVAEESYKKPSFPTWIHRFMLKSSNSCFCRIIKICSKSSELQANI